MKTEKLENLQKEAYLVFDKEDTYDDDECLESFDNEYDARDFCINENAGYGYEKFFYQRAE